jgi:hypothetical protein
MFAPPVEGADRVAGQRQIEATLQVAQGSAGGTLGKTDRSLSGGQQGPERRPQSERGQRSSSISGSWAFTQDCQFGTFRGTFRLSQTDGSSFQGSFSQEAPKIAGTVFDGKIQGRRVSFKATFSAVETWEGTLSSPGRMEGKVTGSNAGGCTWSARRQ